MQVEHTYPIAPRALFDVLVDPAFLQARAARFGGAGEPRVEHADGVVVVTTPRQLPIERVPGSARRLVGDGRVEQVDRWERIGDEQVSGEWSTVVGHAPITMRGTHEIVPAGETGSAYTVTITVDVHVPVIGGRLSREVEGHLEELVRTEQQFTAEWVAQH